jgi:two-component system, cell cycle response regulator
MSRVRGNGGELAIVMIDLDHFKQLNDRHGHLVGDEVLRYAARAIAAACGDDHVVARYGGEEFAVILSGADRQVAVGIAERIRAHVAGAPGSVPVTGSVGVALAPEHGDQGTTVLAAADAALYRAKASGRNRVEVASGAPADHVGAFVA